MQEAFRLADAVAVDQHADHADPERVHEHRQRCRHQEHHRLVPERPAIEDREEIAERQDREQVAQAGTGLGHLQLVDAKVDHVAFEKDRNARQLDEPDPEFRRDELQEDRQLPVDELRQRQHEDQVQHRQLMGAAPLPAEAGQHDAADPEDEGIGDDIGDPDQIAEDAEDQRGNGSPRCPASGSPIGAGSRAAASAQLAQEEIERDQRDQRPVAVFRRDPGRAQRRSPARRPAAHTTMRATNSSTPRRLTERVPGRARRERLLASDIWVPFLNTINANADRVERVRYCYG